jgi:hypothetical protein
MNPTADALKAKARAVRIEDEVARRGIKLRGKIDRVGACPRCGGDDRFSINTKKQIWNCRGCKPDTVTGDIIGLVEHLDGVDYIHAVETLTGERPAIAKPNGHRSPSGRKPPEQQTITYDYRDPDESLAYQVVRRPNKRFAQRRPHGPIIDDKPKAWIWGLLEGTYVRGRNGDYYAAGEHDDENAERIECEACPHILYRLPELREEFAQDPDERRDVHLMEGEKDCETGVAWGLCVTTNSGGAKHWTDVHAAEFVGADVIIHVDNDAAGREQLPRRRRCDGLEGASRRHGREAVRDRRGVTGVGAVC